MAEQKTPWWAGELDRMRPQLRRLVRTVGVHWDVDEIVDQAIGDLSERICHRSTDFPAGWSRSDASPSSEDAQHFRQLVRTITKRRAYDSLRHHYVRLRHDESVSSSQAETDGAARLEARAALQTLSDFVDALPEHDRELLAAPLQPEPAGLTSTQRVKLHRLRGRMKELLAANRCNEDNQ